MEIRKISYTDILDARNAARLLEEYSAECSIPEIGPTNPQRDVYAKMESSGFADSFGLFEGDELIGFAIILVFILPHYGKKIANVESLFVARSHRSGGAGKRLMGHIESFAKESQCVGVLYNARAGGSLERFLGISSRYKRTNSVFLWSAS